MTNDHAKIEAVRRWGPEAIAVRNFQMTANCEVSDRITMPTRWGRGETWESAFMDAEERAARMGFAASEPETLEQERERVLGSCGGKCGEAPCIAWNEEKARRAELKTEVIK